QTQRTQRYHALHDAFGSPTAYDPDFQPKVAADAMKEGSTWTEDQLRYTVSNALNKESPDTQAVVEQPNIIATNTNAKVTLVATGSIGDTLAEDVVIDFADGVRDLTDDEKLALSTAERSDFTIEDDKITIKQRDDVNIDVKGALAATAADQVFLGSESTVNVEDITSTHI